MESGDEFSALHDTSTVSVAKERRAAQKQRNYWFMEDDWPRLKGALANSWYPSLRVKYDESCL